MTLSASTFRTESTRAFITEPLPLSGNLPLMTSSYTDAMYSLYIMPLSLATALMRSVVPEPYWEDFFFLSARIGYPRSTAMAFRTDFLESISLGMRSSGSSIPILETTSGSM